MTERATGTSFSALFAMRDAFARRWRHHEPTPPSVLYHYTSAAGAVGILRSRKLWATLTTFLNDETELTHASGLLNAILSERAAAASTCEEQTLLSRELTAFEFSRQDVFHVFVASFSSSEDDRPQWQLYADRGYGVALGFDGPALLRMGENARRRPNYGLGRVLYQESDQRGFLEWAVAEWVGRAGRSLLRNRRRVGDQAYYLAGLFSYLATCTCEYLPFIKDRHFESECEWRLAHAHDPASRNCCTVYHRGNDDAPYVQLSVAPSRKRLPLVSVWIGPGVATERSRHAMRALLDVLGYSDVAVHVSQVPLRMKRRHIEL